MPAVVNARKVLDRDAFGMLGVFEVQDFRPPAEDELLFTVYGFQGGEVFGLNLETGEVRNYSNSNAYEEVEGVTRTGDAVYVERDLEYEGVDPGALDIWGSGSRTVDGSGSRASTGGRPTTHLIRASRPTARHWPSNFRSTARRRPGRRHSPVPARRIVRL